MTAERNLHLGYRPGKDKPDGQANERNGASGKTVLTEHGPVTDEVMAETIACSNGKLAYTAQRDTLRLGGGSYSVAAAND